MTLARQTKPKARGSERSNSHIPPSGLVSAEPGRQGRTSSRGGLLQAAPAVGWVQSKLVIGRTNDPYEHQADAVADNLVLGRPVPRITPLPAGGLRGIAQRQPEEPEEEPVQTMLVQRQEEEEEEEEEKTAQASTVQRQSEEEEKEEEEPVQTSAIQLQAEEEEEEQAQALSVQRQAEEEEEEQAQMLSVQRQADEEEEAVQELAGASARARPSVGMRRAAASAIRSAGAGVPLRPALRHTLESGLGVDLSEVRVHEGGRAQQAAASLEARAFTHGNQIWLGRGESQQDVRLMAHEATHVVQQSTNVRRASPMHSSASRSDRALVQRTPDNGVEETEQSSLWGMLASGLWAAVSALLPEAAVSMLREISRDGILGFLRNRLSAVLDRLFAGLQDQGGLVGTLVEVFQGLLSRAQEILAALASGDCRPLFAAVRQLVDTVRTMAGNAWNAVVQFFEPVGEWLSDVWSRFGTPVVEWISEVAGDTWEFIQNLARDIWAWTRPLREGVTSIAGDLWGRLKSALGMGGSDEGDSEGGIFSWVSQKATEAWDAIVETVRPVLEPINDIVGRIRELLPMGAINDLRERAEEWQASAGEMGDNVGGPEDVVAQQDRLREAILPAIRGAIAGLRQRITAAGAWIAGAIAGLMEPVMGFIASLRDNPLLRAFGGAVGWIQGALERLQSWATDTVGGLFGFIDQALVRLSGFVEPALNTLQRLVSVIADAVSSLPDLIFGPFWRLIPACLRNVIKDFVVDHILSHIPFFNLLSQARDVWSQIMATAMQVLTQIFVDGDILGAAWTLFSAMLRLLGIPPQLVASILANALNAFVDIFNDPVGFLINFLRALKEGFVNFFGNIGRHLLGGITGWLFGQIQSAGLTPPPDLSLRSILGLVLQILDITRERIFQRLGERIGRERANRLRQMLERGERIAAGVWSWVRTLIDEGPAGLWRRLRERLSDLWQQFLQAAITWVTETVVTRVLARLISMLDPSGVMAVVNSLLVIWDLIQSVIEYLNRMLQIINGVLEGVAALARGAIAGAAQRFENALGSSVPVVIGILARQVGLHRLGRRIAEVVGAIRERVNGAIDWIIDRAIRLGRGLLNLLRRGMAAVRGGVERVTEWWRTRRRFRLGGEQHTLYFDGEGRAATLRIATTPRTLSNFIDFLRNRGVDEAEIAPIEAKAREIDALKVHPSTREELAMTRQQGRLIGDKMTDLSNLIAALNLEGLETQRPPSVIELTPTRKLGGDVGHLMTADPLSSRPGSYTGSLPTQETNLYRAVKRRIGEYVQGHLLNHHTHGPGIKSNLTPITRSLNSRMERDVEDRVKRAVLNNNKVVHYAVTANYPSQPRARNNITEEGFLITSLSFELWELKNKEGRTGENADDWDPGTMPGPAVESVPPSLPHELPLDTPVGVDIPIINLSDTSNNLQELTLIPQIGIGTVNGILNARNTLITITGRARFQTWDELQTTSHIATRQRNILEQHNKVRLHE